MCELISQIIFANKFGDHCSFCENERKKPCSSCPCSNFVLLFVCSIVRANRLILWLLFCERQIHVIIFSAHFYKHQTTTTKANTVSSTKQKCEFQFFFFPMHFFVIIIFQNAKWSEQCSCSSNTKASAFHWFFHSDFVCLRNDVSTQFFHAILKQLPTYIYTRIQCNIATIESSLERPQTHNTTQHNTTQKPTIIIKKVIQIE